MVSKTAAATAAYALAAGTWAVTLAGFAPCLATAATLRVATAPYYVARRWPR